MYIMKTCTKSFLVEGAKKFQLEKQLLTTHFWDHKIEWRSREVFYEQSLKGFSHSTFSIDRNL